MKGVLLHLRGEPGLRMASRAGPGTPHPWLELVIGITPMHPMAGQTRHLPALVAARDRKTGELPATRQNRSIVPPNLAEEFPVLSVLLHPRRRRVGTRMLDHVPVRQLHRQSSLVLDPVPQGRTTPVHCRNQHCHRQHGESKNCQAHLGKVLLTPFSRRFVEEKRPRQGHRRRHFLFLDRHRALVLRSHQSTQSLLQHHPIPTDQDLGSPSGRTFQIQGPGLLRLPGRLAKRRIIRQEIVTEVPKTRKGSQAACHHISHDPVFVGEKFGLEGCQPIALRRLQRRFPTHVPRRDHPLSRMALQEPKQRRRNRPLFSVIETSPWPYHCVMCSPVHASVLSRWQRLQAFGTPKRALAAIRGDSI